MTFRGGAAGYPPALVRFLRTRWWGACKKDSFKTVKRLFKEWLNSKVK